MKHSRKENNEYYATVKQLEDLKVNLMEDRLRNIEISVAKTEAELPHLATKADLKDLENKLDAKISNLENKLGAKISNLENKLDNRISSQESKAKGWAIGILFAILLSFIGNILIKSNDNNDLSKSIKELNSSVKLLIDKNK